MLEKKVFKSREDWLEHREGIGGSDAACVLGLNPYKTNVRLWEEKTGRVQPKDISDLPYVKYGTEAEKYIRALFALDFPEYQVFYEENNAFFNTDFPYAHASLDGWLEEKETGRKGILEIKTSNIMSGSMLDKWKDQVPQNYYIQLLHYFLITGWDFAILKAQLKFEFDGQLEKIETRHYFFERSDCEDDIAMLNEAEKKFYGYVKEDKEPPLELGF